MASGGGSACACLNWGQLFAGNMLLHNTRVAWCFASSLLRAAAPPGKHSLNINNVRDDALGRTRRNTEWDLDD
jgi:hypothetical protein